MSNIQLYNNPRIQVNDDGTIDLVARTRQEAKEALAYVWEMDDGLTKVKEMSLWAKGDLLLQIKGRFPDLDIGEVIENSNDNYKTAWRLLNVSESWPPALREKELSHSVHAEIALTKGIEVGEAIACLEIAKENELGVMRTRQVAKRVAHAEDKEEVIKSLQGCSCPEDLLDLLDADKGSNVRYLFIKESRLVASQTRPEWELGCAIVDMRSKVLLDEDGNPHTLPTNG